MTAKELQKRNGKSENLRVLQTEDGSYYVESSEGKILYNVVLTDDEISCNCGDWARNSKRDANFRCKHVLSVLNCVPKGEVEGAHFLDRKKPQLDAVPAETKTDAKLSEKQTGQPLMSEAQKRAIYNLSRRRGISVEELQGKALESYGVELEHLSSRDASSFIRHLQAS